MMHLARRFFATFTKRDRWRMERVLIVGLAILMTFGAVQILRLTVTMARQERALESVVLQQEDVAQVLNLLAGKSRAATRSADADSTQTLQARHTAEVLPELFERAISYAAIDPQQHAQTLRLRKLAQAYLETDTQSEAELRHATLEAAEKVLHQVLLRLRRINSDTQAQADQFRWVMLWMLGWIILLVLLALFRLREYLEHRHRAVKRVHLARRKVARARAATKGARTARADFLAAITHELRTPLMAVIGYGELLSEELQDPDHKDYAVRVCAAADDLRDIVDNVLNLAQAHPSEVASERSLFSPLRLVDECIATVAPVAAAKRLSLELVAEDALPPAVVCDEVRLRRTLAQLLSNAVKFTETGGVLVTLATGRSAAGEMLLVVSVADTGLGIPAEHCSQIFEPFYQIDASFDRAFGGTGLGLAVARRLVEEMKGEIRLKSEAGRGSTFELRVPVETTGLLGAAPERSAA